MTNLAKNEEELRSKDDNSSFPPGDVVAFNELRSCADIFRLNKQNQLNIQPDFQREEVWNNIQKTKFIDSLLKGLPIPSMCISWDYKKNERFVIDGLQRISSIIKFLSDSNWKMSKLDDVDYRLSGKKVSDLDHDVISRIENVTIPITVIRCDLSKKDHNEFLFTIFHRLNTGGVKLNNQEIRNCIFSGDFNQLLISLSKLDKVEQFLGQNKRFSHQEFILRFFAFFDGLESYSGGLSSFLNDYMYSHKNISDSESESKSELFLSSLDVISRLDIDKKLSKTVKEGLLYGVSKNVSDLKEISNDELQDLYNEFLSLNEFSEDMLKEGLSDKRRVIGRLKAAEKQFSQG
ncbi:DUF262 domain-containing protein [Pasteurellaceae bacterium TAE3-ERU1]|nr:DUF262 domain-containing protein [Pasteurellaceae bacterium TAE3-ERU1]